MSSLAIGNIFIGNPGIADEPPKEAKKEALNGRVVHAAGDNPPDGCCKKIIKVIKAILDHIANGVKHVTGFLAHAVYSHDNIQSLCKFGNSAVAFAKYVFKAESEGFKNLQGQLVIVDGALDVADFIHDLKDWIVPKAYAKDSPKLLFWRHPGVTKWKIIGKALGTAAKALGVVKFTLDVGLLKLGQFSGYLNTIPFFGVIFQFSPLKVVKDSLTIVSSTLGIVDHGIGIKARNPKIELLKPKVKKWEAKNKLFKYLNMNDAEKQAELKGQSEAQYLINLKNNYINARISLNKLGKNVRGGLPNSEKKWASIKVDYENNEVREENKVKCKEKFENKSNELTNSKILNNKSWLAITFNVVKIAAMIMGLIGVFASAIGGTLPFIVTITVAWFITSSIGMARLYYGYKHQHVV